MSKHQSICLLTPGHVSSTPRLIKEAIALQQAGYQILIVAGDYLPSLSTQDQALARQHAWKLYQVSGGSFITRKAFGLLERCFRFVVGCGIPLPLRFLAFADSRWSFRLWNTAQSIPADLYIGHCFASLLPVTLLGKQYKARTGFDAEDYHCGEFLPNSRQNRTRIKIRRRLETLLLPTLSYRTSAAPLISEIYSADYQVPFVTILNVFPKTEAPPKPVARTDEHPIRFFWFSQVIGPERGLEEFVAIMAQLPFPCQLHLLGFQDQDFARQISSDATRLGLRDAVFWHDFVVGSELPRLAAQFDLGICVEPNYPPHKSLCLANKIFTYLLAGLPVLLSSTRAHKDFAAGHQEYTLLVDLPEVESAAQMLTQKLLDRQSLQAMQQKAWEAADTIYNWETESKMFLSTIARLWEPS